MVLLKSGYRGQVTGDRLQRVSAPWVSTPIPFSLAVDEADGVGDGAWFGRVGVFGPFGIEGGDAAFDDARVGAVAAWREGSVGDLGEEVVQQAVEKKGEACEVVRAR
jgi:hypothetical protein